VAKWGKECEGVAEIRRRARAGGTASFRFTSQACLVMRTLPGLSTINLSSCTAAINGKLVPFFNDNRDEGQVTGTTGDH